MSGGALEKEHDGVDGHCKDADGGETVTNEGDVSPVAARSSPRSFFTEMLVLDAPIPFSQELQVSLCQLRVAGES
jgi:hypothetical protein